jgi:hypothetical protein
MCQRRVLLACVEVEVRQVQFCKCMTTIEGSLEPLCRLTHSIIQARRCRRVTMRPRSLVSTSSRALTSCSDLKGEGDTHPQGCVGLHACKLRRYCQGMLFFEVGDGFNLLVQVQQVPRFVLVFVTVVTGGRPAMPSPCDLCDGGQCKRGRALAHLRVCARSR